MRETHRTPHEAKETPKSRVRPAFPAAGFLARTHRHGDYSIEAGMTSEMAITLTAWPRPTAQKDRQNKCRKFQGFRCE